MRRVPGGSTQPPAARVPPASRGSPDAGLCLRHTAERGWDGAMPRTPPSSPRGRTPSLPASLRWLPAPPSFTGGSDTPFSLHLKKMSGRGGEESLLGVVRVCPPAHAVFHSAISFTRRTREPFVRAAASAVSPPSC